MVCLFICLFKNKKHNNPVITELNIYLITDYIGFMNVGRPRRRSSVNQYLF